MKRRIVVAVIISILLNIVIVSIYFSITSDVNPIDHLLKRNRITAEERGWLDRKGALIYGSDRNSPPLRYVDEESGQYIGLVVDYVNALSIEIGVEIKLEPQIWSMALQNLADGESDLSDMFPSRERAEKYLFSDAIYNLRGIIVVRANDTAVQGIGELREKVIAVPKGDYAADFLISRNPEQRILYTRDNLDALEMVKTGRADAVVGDEPVLSYFMKRIENSGLLKILPKPAYEMECVLAVPKSERILAGILNKGIYHLRTKDTMLKIQQKWLGVSASFVQAKRAERVLVLLLISLILMLLVLYVFSQWNRTLKREVARRTEELILSRNELQITFDGLSHLLILYNTDCTITNMNRAFSEFAGRDKDDLLNRHCRSMAKSFFEGCDACIVKSTFQHNRSFKVEVSRRSSIFQLSTYPIELNRAEVQKVLLMVRDVTSERISERKYLQNNKMAAIGQLVAGMAHEIRNPLGLIRNYSYVLRRSLGKCEPQVTRNIGLIESSVDKASNIIDNLLNFSRLDDDTAEDIPIREFIEDIFQLEGKMMLQKRITGVVECDAELCYRINREVLKHVVMNLVVNAIDAMPDGGVLRFEVQRSEGLLLIVCSDTGTGISREHLDSIFNPFFTTKRRGSGTGLGLYIVYRDVRRYGGDITVESAPGKGSTFTVSLPLMKGAVDEPT